MIDQDGYRPNVCMVIVNRSGQVFWAKRARENAWQFPQGGIDAKESAKQSLDIQKNVKKNPEAYFELGIAEKGLGNIVAAKDAFNKSKKTLNLQRLSG